MEKEYICSECGADVSLEDTICPKCGEDIREVEEDYVCNNCGGDVTEEDTINFTLNKSQAKLICYYIIVYFLIVTFFCSFSFFVLQRIRSIFLSLLHSIFSIALVFLVLRIDKEIKKTG
ncbi:MAG: zinc-ribbon domain-containing protein [Asgard group archaeon]|nr:zinc-ribbon domain-containing protein [Asgard group archaeon]